MNDPTERGLEIHPDPPEGDLDVFAYVLDALRKDGDEERPLTAVDFVYKARELFTANQLVSTYYTEPGLGLQLQDGTRLRFCAGGEDMSGIGGISGGVDITKSTGVSRGGKGATVPSGVWGITSGGE